MPKKVTEETRRALKPNRRSLLVGVAAAATAGAMGFNRSASAAAAGDEAITQTAKFGFDLERADEATEALRNLISAVEEKEPGVLAYIAHQPTESPGTMFFFEVYADAAALENHGKQPHLAALGAGFQSGLFKGPVEIVKLDKVAGFSR